MDAICEACIQVLLDGGMERLTTTRVAQRAGASVGSVYQYFPNKQSLLAAVLERHLLRVVEAVEAACTRAKGQPTAVMATELVASFVAAKFDDPATSLALYAVAAEIGGAAVVAQSTRRCQIAVCTMLATAIDRQFSDLESIGFVLCTAVIGPVQGLLAANAPPKAVRAIRAQLTAMIASYLLAAGKPRPELLNTT